MAIAEITAIITSLKNVTDIVKELINLKSDSTIKEKSTELLNIIVTLQEYVLSLQTKHSELLQSKNDLEKKLIDIESWEKEKAKYELAEISPHVFVFSTKKNDDSSQKPHWLCANCYNDNKKSILQFTRSDGSGSHYTCHKCKSIITKYSEEYLALHKQKRSWPITSNGSSGWMGR